MRNMKLMRNLKLIRNIELMRNMELTRNMKLMRNMNLIRTIKQVVQKVGKLILDKLVSPLQSIITTDEELQHFMAIILFDPC